MSLPFGLFSPRPTLSHPEFRERFGIAKSYRSSGNDDAQILTGYYGHRGKTFSENGFFADFAPSGFVEYGEWTDAHAFPAPNVIYNYYRHPNHGASIALLIVEDTVADIDWQTRGRLKEEGTAPFIMFARLNADNPMDGDLSILSMRVDGRKIKLEPNRIERALQYADILYGQIVSDEFSERFDPAEARRKAYGGAHIGL